MTKVFGNKVALTGKTSGSLFVQGVISSQPLRYYCLCRLCGIVGTYTHSELLQGRECKDAACWQQRQRRAQKRQAREPRATWLPVTR